MNEEVRKTTIGGQALIEGLLMMGPDAKAIAMRHPQGQIVVETEPLPPLGRAATIPLVRGSVRLIKQMTIGVKALTRSAALQDEAEDENGVVEVKAPTRFDRFAERHHGFMTALSVVLGVTLSVVLFMLLPSLLTDLVRRLSGLPIGAHRVLLSLLEGVFRIAIFVAYLFITSKLKVMRRVWMYHGAEHKTIACYEACRPLTVENVLRFSRFHPRCGTSFLFLVMIVSILILALVPRSTALVNVAVRIVLLPVIAGVSYEIIRLAGKYDNVCTRFVSKPGLWLQRLTTSEPDASIIEVAVAAMKAVLPQRAGSDAWT